MGHKFAEIAFTDSVKDAQQANGSRKAYARFEQGEDSHNCFSDREIEFNRVVAIQYPREGVWSLGFVTGNSLSEISEATGEQMLSVLMPTSPMPMTIPIGVRILASDIPLGFSASGRALKLTREKLPSFSSDSFFRDSPILTINLINS